MIPKYGYSANFASNETLVVTPEDMGNKLKKGTIVLICTDFDSILYV